MTTATPVTWGRREPPLEPVAVVGRGPVVAPLAAAAAPRASALRAVAGDGWLVLLGDDLPWADGATYLGWDDGLLVPVLLRPSRPAGVLLRAARARAPAGAGLWILLPDALLAAPLPAGCADAASLAAIAGAGAGGAAGEGDAG